VRAARSLETGAPKFSAGVKRNAGQTRFVVIHPDTQRYNETQAPEEREICNRLAKEIDRHLPEAENKIWHAHPSGSWREIQLLDTAS
jgi:hypothetical protein